MPGRNVKNIGDKLRNERESKGLTIEDVVRDTNIAKKYLAALENEDFAIFPAEAYILGFLKNYGDYLGLDSAELKSQYQILKIQEQPVPVEQLLRSSSQLPRVLITVLIAVAGLALLGGSVYFVVTGHLSKSNAANTGVISRAPADYTLTDASIQKRFYKNDTVSIPVLGNDYKVTVSSLGEIVTVTTPVGDYKLGLND
ncbi:MAG: helix-turn-helix domain-containing protein, partial [Spirochaetaceae bacterium]|nr:helix-turn-helix domain-containing protein [Spirochaetaceae bacterium]